MEMPSLEVMVREMAAASRQVRRLFHSSPAKTNGSVQSLILLHGFMAGNFSTQGLAAYLKHDYYVIQLSYDTFQDLATTERDIIPQIHAVHDLLQTPVNLLGHSLGGVLAFSLAQQHPHYFHTVISLAGPFQGLAHLKPIENFLPTSLYQLLPHSPYLNTIHSRSFPSRVTFHTVQAATDFIVPFPCATLPLDGIQNHVLPDMGHWTSLEEPHAYRFLAKLLPKQE